jgi:hypothetical protein
LKKFLLILTLFISSASYIQAQNNRSGPGPATAQANFVRFYPNPATTAITFDFQRTFEKGFTIQIYNFLGRKMVELTNIGDRTSINLTDFTRGVYVYKLFDKSGRLMETGKFQVSK